MASVTALQADSFVDAVGVNVHSAYGVNDPTNAYAGDWTPLVPQLGIRHVRDNISTVGATGAASLAAAMSLQSRGIDTLYIVHGSTSLANLLASSMPPPAAVEPWNEWDSNGGASWASALQSFQPTLYTQIKAQWPSCMVLGASLADNTKQSQVGSLAPNVDANNVHVYEPPAQVPEYAPLFSNTQLSTYKTQGPSKPIWLTETGLVHGSLTDSAALTSELSAARLLPRTLLYAWAPNTLATVTGSPWPTGIGGLGAERMYIYELLDEHNPTAYSSPTEDRFGLFTHDLTPKIAATALGNLLGLLADPGDPFMPESLDITTSDGAAPFSYILFQKRNGDFWLAYWRGSSTTTDDLVARSPDQPDVSVPITLQFDRTFRITSFYRPLQGEDPVKKSGATNILTLDTRLDVQLVKLSGRVRSGVRARGTRSYYDTRETSLG